MRVRRALEWVLAGVHRVVRREALGRNPGLAEPDQIDDGLPIERPGQRLAYFELVERRLAAVEQEQVRKECSSWIGLDVGRFFEILGLLQRNLLDPVQLTLLQARQPHGVVGDGLEDDFVKVRFVGPVVLFPALEGDVVVLHPFSESVRSRADRLQLRIVRLDGLFIDDVAEGCQRAHQAAPVRLRHDSDRRIVHDFHTTQRREEDCVCRGQRLVEETVEGILHIRAGELLTVVEEGIVDEVELPGRVVELLP